MALAAIMSDRRSTLARQALQGHAGQACMCVRLAWNIVCSRDVIESNLRSSVVSRHLQSLQGDKDHQGERRASRGRLRDDSPSPLLVHCHTFRRYCEDTHILSQRRTLHPAVCAVHHHRVRHAVISCDALTLSNLARLTGAPAAAKPRSWV